MIKTWAEWFAVLTGGMHVPIKIFEIMRSAAWLRVTMLVIDIDFVFYLLYVLIRDGEKKIHTVWVSRFGSDKYKNEKSASESLQPHVVYR